MDTTIIYIDNYLQQGIVHQLMSLGNLVLPGDLANQSRERRRVMRLTGRQLPAAMDSRSRRAGDGGTLGLIFPLIYLFFPLTFCRNAILYSKSTQKKVILFATFIFRENAPSRQSEVIQLLNEFCRIGVAYSLRNYHAKILGFKEEAKRRCRAGVQVHISYRYRTLHRCIRVMIMTHEG